MSNSETKINTHKFWKLLGAHELPALPWEWDHLEAYMWAIRTKDPRYQGCKHHAVCCGSDDLDSGPLIVEVVNELPQILHELERLYRMEAEIEQSSLERVPATRPDYSGRAPVIVDAGYCYVDKRYVETVKQVTALLSELAMYRRRSVLEQKEEVDIQSLQAMKRDRQMGDP